MTATQVLNTMSLNLNTTRMLMTSKTFGYDEVLDEKDEGEAEGTNVADRFGLVKKR